MGSGEGAEGLSEAESLWRAAAGRILEGGGLARVVTYDDIPVKPLYRPNAGTISQPLKAVGACGIVQRADHPDFVAANAMALVDLEGGASGLSLVLAGAGGARGFGVRLATATDLERLLDHVALESVAIRCEGAARLPFDLAAALGALARKRHIDPSQVEIDWGLDPIGDLARLGGAARPWTEEADVLLRDYRAIRREGFRSPVVRADGRPYHEAGATEAQELAAVLATGVAYLRLLERGGIALEEACASLSHCLVADVDALPTISKFRAFRRLWASVEAACGLRPCAARLHGETAWRVLTRRDPWTNILRGTIGCAGAFLGGADSVAVLPFTLALGLPDTGARRLSRNTALILHEESHLSHAADPAAGSGAFEAMTEALGEEAWRLFQAIEAEGGFPQALLSGFWQSRIAEASEKRRRDVAHGSLRLTGTNHFPPFDEGMSDVLQSTPAFSASPGPDLAVRCDPLPSHRDAEPFERLRDRSDAWRELHGTRPRVAVSASCSAFARSVLDIGGFKIVMTDGQDDRKTRHIEDMLREGSDMVAALDLLWDGGFAS